MRLFFSGFGAHDIDLDPRIPRGPRYRLLSCHEEYLRVAHEFSTDLCTSMEDPFELMYDSGAFTAWSKGKEVVLDDLIRVYDEMMGLYSHRAANVWLISLDKIPGSPGRTAGPAEIEDCCRISDENYSILEKRYGQRVLPVFHQNESTARLHEVAAMAPYICVSPRNDLHETARVRWSAEVHAQIPGKDTHGLAATGYTMMTTIPWGSVDSASWIFCATNGGVIRDHHLRVLQMSDKSSALKNTDQHFKTLPIPLQETFRAFVEARGFTVEGLAESFRERLVWNRVMITELYQSIPQKPDIPMEVGLFDL
jgi:hypothetical protein